MVKYLKKLKFDMFVRLFFHFIYISAIAGMPRLISIMVDSKYEHGYQDVAIYATAFLLLAVVGMSAQYITQCRSWKLTVNFYNLIRQDLFSAIIRKKPAEFKNKTIGDYSTMLNNDIEACQDYLDYLFILIESYISLVVYAVYIFTLDFRLAIAMYFIGIVTMFLPRLTGKEFSKRKKNLLAKTAQYNTKVIDILNGYSHVNYQTYPNLLARHNEKLSEMERSRYSHGKFKTFVNVLNGSVMYMIDFAVFVLVAILLYKRYITFGVATAIWSYVASFMFPLREIVDNTSLLKSLKETTQSVFAEIDKSQDLHQNQLTFMDCIKLEDVSYSYDNFELKNFSYTFKKGYKYAIVGESGAGKSTILNLMFGVLDGYAGRIEIDNATVSYALSNQVMVYLDQNCHVFNDDFLDNVTLYGSYDSAKSSAKVFSAVSDEKREILQSSTNCAELSGGEQQLVSFIQSLAAQRDILLLDEPFSAMDKKLELALTKLLLGLKDKTVIMVTHNRASEFLSMFDEVLEL